ncbi:hypothetical protein OVA03_16055 [Asticcacaulis sp. SL142]|uniref:hypothetical protein n=1 Tax=Asticcacaulis sp. SL142 TaxID=2995155 RepID=UPI00226D3F6F|nr:hypothetical protein [Asticcacaulis sp. SL142]WAC48184.1 hypothetical protein OVA03_16055 [Asticcacaulis sp. SL142]
MFKFSHLLIYAFGLISAVSGSATAGSIDTPNTLPKLILDPIRQQALAQKQPVIDADTLKAIIDKSNKETELKAQPLVPLPGSALDASQQAATPAEDPAFLERVDLMRKLFEVDGTDEITRQFINNIHMRLIILEVNNYIDINSLSESDKYRIAAIAAVAATELGDKVLNLGARQHALYLTRDEIVQLTADLSNGAQKKLTYIRMNDDGAVDKRAEIDMQIAALKIIQAYETAPAVP